MAHREELYTSTYEWAQLQIECYGPTSMTNYKMDLADGHFNYFIELAGSVKVKRRWRGREEERGRGERRGEEGNMQV